MADYHRIDVTEIDGFDNLHQAEGILREGQLRANCLYGADETYFMINGSTGGMMAAVMAAGPKASCVQAAQAALNGETNVGTVTHFRRAGGIDGIIIGNHVFY